jgi:hypothetical protein
MLYLKKLAFTIALTFTIVCVSAQDYRTAIGLRLGALQSGITVKGFVNSNSALEGILGFAPHTFVLTGLYEYHMPIQSAPSLKWYVGGGAHVAFFRYGGRYTVWYYDHHGRGVYVDEPGATATAFGLDFILGLDYKFPNAPFNMGLDLKPFVDFAPDGPWVYFDGAFSFRFAF